MTTSAHSWRSLQLVVLALIGSGLCVRGRRTKAPEDDLRILPRFPCIPVTAPFHKLMEVVGIGRGRAQMIANARFCPFEDAADLKARFEAQGDGLGQWGILEGLLGSGALCVGGKQEKGGCVQINGASKWNLKTLAGIDEDLAAKIIDVRTCPYKDVDDMEQRLKEQPDGVREWPAIQALFHVEEFGLCLPGRDDNYATGAGGDPAVGGGEEDTQIEETEEAEDEQNIAENGEQAGDTTQESGAEEPDLQPGAGDSEQDRSEASAAGPAPETPAAGGPSPAPPSAGAPPAAGASPAGEAAGGAKKPAAKKKPPTHGQSPNLSGHRYPGRIVGPDNVPLRPTETRVKPVRKPNSGKPSWVTVTAKRCADGCNSAMDPYYRLVEVREISAAVALMVSAGHFCPFTSKADFETRFRAADKRGSWTKVNGLLSSGYLCVSGSACANINDMTVYELSLVLGVDADLAADILAAGTCPYEDEADMEKKVKAQKGGARYWPEIKELIDDGCLCVKK